MPSINVVSHKLHEALAASGEVQSLVIRVRPCESIARLQIDHGVASHCPVEGAARIDRRLTIHGHDEHEVIST